jgi:hypothetical protein
MKYLLIISCLLCIVNFSYGQENWNTEIENHFLIAASTKDYSTAAKSARLIADKMGLRLIENEEYSNKKYGLTYSQADCEGDGFDYPCYIPRGGPEQENYVSIEWSSMYAEFSEGYYIIVIANSPKRDNKIPMLLQGVKEFAPTAHIKSAMIWYGCLH